MVDRMGVDANWSSSYSPNTEYSEVKDVFLS